MPSTADTSALAHHRELHELLRRAIDVGAEVEHRRHAFLGRQLRGDRRPVDARQRLQHEARDRHQRAGVARGHAGLRGAVLDQVDRHAHRRVLLVAQRERRRLVHLDDFGRGVDDAADPTPASAASRARRAAARPARPRSRARRACVRETSSAAASVTEGPWSPPIASTATVTGMRESRLVTVGRPPVTRRPWS